MGVAYYNRERTTAQGVGASGAGRCLVKSPAEGTHVPTTAEFFGPDWDPTIKHQLDFSTNESFKDLGFTLPGGSYHIWAIGSYTGTGACNTPAGPLTAYSFWAAGDLDGDGIPSALVQYVGVNAEREMFKAGSVWQVDNTFGGEWEPD